MADDVAQRLAAMRVRSERARTVRGRDGEFIAHARTDLDDLRGAVEDVLTLHPKVRHHTSASTDLNYAPTFIERCARCQADSTLLTWPCPTVAAITKQLGGAR